jgi:outer membrane protein insertion porin family
MGYDLTEYLRQTLSYQFRGDRIYHFDHDAPSIIREEEGWKYYSIIGQTLTYDRRDSQFDPRDGYFVTLDTHFSGAGGDVKYISGSLKGGYFYPATKDVTLSVSQEVGYIQPLFGDYLHYPDGFFLGGSDSLRGFDDHGVGPREQGARKKVGSIGGQFLWDGTVQASFPLGLPEEYQIRGRVFSDFGVLTGYDPKNSSVKINDDGSIRASAGFGITWVSPFGPLAVDLAYPVVREDQDKIQYFSFSFGTNF